MASTTLRDCLEEYLKREGLYEVISEHRRSILFTFPTALMWMVALWASTAYFVFKHKGFNEWLIVIVGPPILLLGTLIVLAFYFLLREYRSDKKFTDADTGAIGTVFLFFFPVLMAAALGLYLQSWSTAILYILLSVISFLIILFFQAQAYRVHLVFELVSSMLKVLWRAIALLVALVPLLLIVVLLSVFSGELWQVVGVLPWIKLLVGIILIALPAFLFVLTSLDDEAIRIVGDFPSDEKIAEFAEGIPFIKTKLEGGIISSEEWARLSDDLQWRHKTKLDEDLLPMLRTRTKRWFALLLGLTSIALVVSFFVYFYILFSVMLKASTIETWVQTQLDPLVVPLNFFGHSWEVSLPVTTVPVAKVSLLLATFVAAMSSVYALTDDSFKERFTGWLRQKAASWLAASCLYQCATSPNYQVWDYKVKDEQKGIAHAFIVVPQGSSEEEAQKACEHMESRLQGYRNFVTVTAFEQISGRSVYRYGMPGNRWRLIHNKIRDFRKFEANPFIPDELRGQHLFGIEHLQNETEIPNEWFGNAPEGIALAKAVWEDDTDHDLVMHPYTFQSSSTLTLEIHLMRRMAKSSQYRQYMRNLLAMVSRMEPDAPTIDIELFFRDTPDSLARLFWARQFEYVEYKDELQDEKRAEQPDDWGLAQGSD